MRKINSPYQQRGATALGMLSIITVLGLGLYALILLVPVYLDNYEVVNTMKSISEATTAEETNPDQLRTSLNRAWTSGYIDDLDYQDVVIKKVGRTYEMTAAYRVERRFLGNISMVVDFDKTMVVD
jgi:hypothetical protein